MKKLMHLFILLPSLIISSCHFIGGKRVHGSGNIITEERRVSQFNRIETRGSVDVFVKQDSTHSVKLEGDDNLLEFIEVIDDGDVLIIRERRGYRLRPRKGLKIFIGSPEFKEIRVSGASDVTSQNKITNAESFYVKVSGAGDIRMDVNSPKVTAKVSGSGTINMKGEAKEFEADISGAGDINCFDMLAENTHVEISGAGNADVYASIKLDARVSGAGSIKYKGNASVNQKVSGAGSVTKVN